MTVSSTLNRTSLNGNNVTTTIPIVFPFQSAADLVVLLVVVASGVQTTETLTTHYTVTGTPDALGHYSNGGAVEMVTPPTTLQRVVVYRDPARTQGLDLVENDNLPAESVEAQLDYVTMLLQRVADLIGRSLRQPDGDSAAIATMPSKVDRSSRFQAYDANGDPIAAAGTSANLGPVSGFINTLLDDADAPTSRTTLGAVGLTGNETVAGNKTFSGTVIPQGLLDLSGAAAGQAKFPATQNPSANANTLDDYKESTGTAGWTPVVTFATPGNLSVVYSVQQGGYLKIGRLVHAWANLELSTFTHTTASGNFRITGLPFAVGGSSVNYAGTVALSGWTKANYTQITAVTNIGVSDTVEFQASGSGQALATLAVADVPTGGTPKIRLHVYYASVD